MDLDAQFSEATRPHVTPGDFDSSDLMSPKHTVNSHYTTLTETHIGVASVMAERRVLNQGTARSA